MKSYLAKSRLVPLVLIFGMILLIFCGVLYNTQILNGSDYKARSLASNATAQTVEASRGIITDRNGKVLISNRLTYTLVFSDEEFESDTDCNNAISGGAFVPLLSLGIPGDAGTAVMLGSLTMLGLAPGPLLFTEHKDSVYMLFVGLFMANLLMGLLGFAGIRLWSRVLDIPQKILLPLIFTFCFVGTYACNRSINDVYMMIIAGIVGYVLQKLDFALPPIILGVILGGMIEKNFRRALILSNGDVGTFFTRPISCVFIILAVVSLFSPVIKTVIASKKAKKQAAAAVNDSESAS